MPKPMTKAAIGRAQKSGGLNAAQRAADNRQDAKVRRAATGGKAGAAQDDMARETLVKRGGYDDAARAGLEAFAVERASTGKKGR